MLTMLGALGCSAAPAPTEILTDAPVTDLSVGAGGVMHVAGGAVFLGGARLEAPDVLRAVRAGGRVHGYAGDMGGAVVDGEVARMRSAYAVLGDDAGAVVLGLDNDAPSGSTLGWARALGDPSWEVRVPGLGYASFLSGVLAGDHVLAVGASDLPSGERYVPWIVMLDRATGTVRSQHHARVGGWAVPVVALPRGDGFLIVGHAADRQPSMEVRGQPFVLPVMAEGRPGSAMLLDTDVLGAVSDAALAPDGTLWLVSTTRAPGGTWKDGPYHGILGRWDGKALVWKALPGCPPADHVETDASRIWLAGHDGRRQTGFVRPFDPAGFDALDGWQSCAGS